MSMDIHDLRRKVLAMREYRQKLGEVEFHLRLPTDHEIQVAGCRVGGKGDQADLALLMRSLLEHALIGWGGVMVSHMVPGHEPDEPQDFDPAAVPLLLDAQPGWAGELSGELAGRLSERARPKEEAEKN